MTKVGIVFHALGLISGITGAFLMADYGWQVWQWPLISCVWIIASFVSGMSLKQTEGYLEDTYKELRDLRQSLHNKEVADLKAAFDRAGK